MYRRSVRPHEKGRVALLTRPHRCADLGWFGALGLLTIVALSKIAYAPLLLFCLLPVAAPGLWRRVVFMLLAGACKLSQLPSIPPRQTAKEAT
jgi:hypothetical protein